MGSGAEKRNRVMSVLAAKMKAEGKSLSEISEATGIKRELVNARAQLGERLLSLDDPIRAHE